MFKVSHKVLMSLSGEKHLKQRKKPYKGTKKNFRGTITILLSQDDCKEMTDKVAKGRIMKSLIYHA